MLLVDCLRFADSGNQRTVKKLLGTREGHKFVGTNADRLNVFWTLVFMVSGVQREYNR